MERTIENRKYRRHAGKNKNLKNLDILTISNMREGIHEAVIERKEAQHIARFRNHNFNAQVRQEQAKQRLQKLLEDRRDN